MNTVPTATHSTAYAAAGGGTKSAQHATIAPCWRKAVYIYSDAAMPVITEATAKIRKAELFVAVLGVSNYIFAEATRSQSLPDWIGSHIRAFEFFGGMRQLLIPDNLRSAVTKADRYHPNSTPPT